MMSLAIGIDRDLEVVLSEFVSDLINESLMDDAFDMHRAMKLGYYELLVGESPLAGNQPITSPGAGSSGGRESVKTANYCSCIKCGSKVAATRYASHLSKCMGLGRNSSRRANRRIAEQQRFEDFDEDDWLSDQASGSSSVTGNNQPPAGEEEMHEGVPAPNGLLHLRTRRNGDQVSCGGSADGDSPLIDDEDSDGEIEWTHDVRL